LFGPCCEEAILRENIQPHLQSWTSIAQNAGLGAHTLILEKNPEIWRPSLHALPERWGKVQGGLNEELPRLDINREIEDSRKGRRPGYMFGAVASINHARKQIDKHSRGSAT
jgi:hypothetical protein